MIAKQDLQNKIKKLKSQLTKLKQDVYDPTSTSSIRPRTSYSYHYNCKSDLYSIATASTKSRCDNCKNLLSLGLSTASCKYHQLS